MGFFRFPHTPHLSWHGKEASRADKVLSPPEVAALLSADVVIEEKLDGANLGISVSSDGELRLQNRGDYLRPPFSGQFQHLPTWLSIHQDQLFDALGINLIAFGEWCAAQHSLEYSRLPDRWMLFDIYDRRAKRYWSTSRRNAWARENGLKVVREVARGHFSQTALLSMVEREHSAFRDGFMEGIVIRRESDQWLIDRAKLVRADFSQSISEHWRRQPLRWNRVAMMAD